MVLCPLHHAALQASLWGHSEGTPVALSPQCIPKDTCPLATSPSHIWLPQEPVQKACTLSISHPEPVHPWGTPTCLPFLSHVISGAGKPLASHSRVRDCPAMPDTLALRPSSRRLGGTWEKEKQRCCPSAGQPQPGTPFGPFFLAWRAVPTPPLPQLLGFQDAHSRLWPSGAVWTWEWPQRPHPGRAQELYSLRHSALQAAGAIGSIQFSTQTVVMVTKEGA